MIRVGDLVRVLRYPTGLTDLAGEPVIDPPQLLGPVWRVRSVGRSGHIWLDLRPGGFQNRAGQPIDVRSFAEDIFEAVGHEPPVVGEHLTPVLTAMVGEGATTVSVGDIWPAKRNGIAVDRRPGPSAETQIALLSPDQERWIENDPHYPAEEGLYCWLCGDALNWPASR